MSSPFVPPAGLPFRKSTASFDAGPKGKIPFIVHGPHIIGDTQLIIEYLRRCADTLLWRCICVVLLRLQALAFV